MGPQIRQYNVYIYILLLLYVIVYCMYIYIHCMGLATTWGWSLILGYHPQLCFGSTAYHNKTIHFVGEPWNGASLRGGVYFFYIQPQPIKPPITVFLVLPGRWIVVWQPSGRLYFLNPSGLTTKKEQIPKKNHRYPQKGMMKQLYTVHFLCIDIYCVYIL